MGPSDTSDEAREQVLEHWRSCTPLERAAAVGRLNAMVLTLAQARQDLQYPQATPEERKLRLASLWLEREAMIRYWAWDPKVHGR